ncbi:hypothetical protein [Spirillospora sp. CA-294931]|uniref:hypothetical protein n=1 Tax=Spirillospora sp. CA-294931 TaxID=3240042 RepID=UPI003D919330
MSTATPSLFQRLHGRPAEGVPRAITLAAYATTLVVLPSGIWRIALGFGAPLGPLANSEGDSKGDLPTWFPGWMYVILLTLVTEALAFLTVGLVSRWGEVFPGWIPLLGGRRVPTLAAVIPAGLGAAALTVLAFGSALSYNEFRAPDGTTVYLEGWKLAVFVLSYGPLLAWGPLLGAVTVAYYLRRRRRT